MSGRDEEFQATAQQLQAIESQLEALETQVQTLRARKAEVDDAIEAIQSLDSGSTVQVPVGGNAYIRASVEDMDEVIVGIGGGYASEQSEADAVSILEDRHDRIDSDLEDLGEAIADLRAKGEELDREAQEQLRHLQGRVQQEREGGG